MQAQAAVLASPSAADQAAGPPSLSELLQQLDLTQYAVDLKKARKRVEWRGVLMSVEMCSSVGCFLDWRRVGCMSVGAIPITRTPATQAGFDQVQDLQGLSTKELREEMPSIKFGHANRLMQWIRKGEGK
jgi:hypothetical protein